MGRKVSLVGWSLGGLFARELAKEVPELVRCVITLGTPFTGHPEATNAWRLFELVSGQSVHDEETLAGIRRPPPLPTTSIYSRTDGVVAWHCSLNDPAPLAENIEVHASHMGNGHEPAGAVRGGRPPGPGPGSLVALRPARHAALALPLDAPRAPGGLMQIPANGISIEVDDRGPPGGPAVLLIMGLGMQLVAWPDELVDDPGAPGLSACCGWTTATPAFPLASMRWACPTSRGPA